MLFHGISVPVSMVLVADDDLTIKKVLIRIGRLAIDVNTGQLFNIWFHDLGPCLAIVKVYSIDASLLCKLDDFINQ